MSKIGLHFTVILVTFRRLDLFEKAIQSIQNQSLLNYECLVFNDYPQENEFVDNIISILNDPRFKFIPSKQSLGANHWRNVGVTMAKGEYIAFLDDDDRWFQDKLNEHYSAHKSENAFLVFSDYIKTWKDASRPALAKTNAIMSDDIVKAIKNGDFSISTTSSVSISNSLNWTLFDESLVSFQDWDAWLGIKLNKPDAKFYRIEKPLLYFVQHESERVSRNYNKRLKALHQLLFKYQEKSLNISGFFYKEKLNLLILKLESRNRSALSKFLLFIGSFFSTPSYLRYSYTYRRLARYLFKEGKI